MVPKPNRAGVPKRWTGATWNLAHPRAYGLLALFVVVGAGPALLLFHVGQSALAWVALGASVILGSQCGWHLATR